MNNSIERIVPDFATEAENTGKASLQLHTERYHYAGRYLIEGNVADIACGTGYGSYILATQYSQKATAVLAVDNNTEAIQYAAGRYTHHAIRFLEADITLFRPAMVLQNIVCLETLEHLADPAAFVKHITTYLQPDGLFIASVPITPSMDANPYHLHDFTAASFKKMFAMAGFSELVSMVQIQPYKWQEVLRRKEKRVQDTRRHLFSYYMAYPDKFLLRLQSLVYDGFCNKYLMTVFRKNSKFS
jgi:2-polyprenyl-3-methyl-5-hydroxy-6-metoxy-1,4-benzoquinol methylase